MEAKLLVITIVLLVIIGDVIQADFSFQHYPPKEEDLASLGLECIPRKTVIKMEEKPKEIAKGSEEEETVEETRRSHMNAGQMDSERCKVCVCAVDGKTEYCSRRPARNINECIRLATLTEKLQKNIPYDHTATLAYRIRRDYIWHYDEIPYESDASCARASSYYTRNPRPNETTIENENEDENLEANNNEFCFYCVCSVSGKDVDCISRNVWYCNLYSRSDADSERYRYKILFGEDRPAYFRTLSYRLRRNMEEGVKPLLDIGGDTLCCGHPDGHRRNLHNHIRNKIRQLRRKVPKENILGNSPKGDYVDFVVNND